MENVLRRNYSHFIKSFKTHSKIFEKLESNNVKLSRLRMSYIEINLPMVKGQVVMHQCTWHKYMTNFT